MSLGQPADKPPLGALEEGVGCHAIMVERSRGRRDGEVRPGCGEAAADPDGGGGWRKGDGAVPFGGGVAGDEISEGAGRGDCLVVATGGGVIGGDGGVIRSVSNHGVGRGEDVGVCFGGVIRKGREEGSDGGEDLGAVVVVGGSVESHVDA